VSTFVSRGPGWEYGDPADSHVGSADANRGITVPRVGLRTVRIREKGNTVPRADVPSSHLMFQLFTWSGRPSGR